MDFIERIEELIEERGLNKKQVLSECNLSKNSFVNWKNGIKPQASAVSVLAQYFGVSSNYLLGIDEKKERLLDILDEPLDFQNSQIQALVKYFSNCDADGQFRIIHMALTEYERCEEERKKEAYEAVAKLKVT